MTVQERIYAMMEEKNMCQSRVARSAGIDPKLFNSMLRGRKLIRLEDINPICEALKCEPNDLFSDAPKSEH